MPTLKLTAIKPPKMPTGEQYVKAMQAAVLKSANLVQRDLQSTVASWSKKPKFTVSIEQNGDDYIVTASTDSEIYGYVDLGTRSHIIRPKRSRYLRFQSGYRSKGRTGVIGSQAGGSFGDAVFAKEVHHPGFAGRHWTVLIARRRQMTITQEVSQAISKINRAK